MNTRIIFLSVLIANLFSYGACPAKPKNQRQEEMLTAIKNDSPAEVWKVIQSVITQGKEGKSPMYILLMAIMNGTTEEIKKAVQPVLEQGKFDKTPMTWAVLLMKSNAVEALLECGAKFDANIAAFAAKMGDIKTALVVVKSGADISGLMDEYMTLAMNYVTQVSHKDIAMELIQELIKRGYNINNMWKFGVWKTAAYPVILDLLIKKGIDVNHVFEDKSWKGSSWTPLIAAAIYGDIQAIKFLLGAGANINQKGNPLLRHPINGLHTPFYFAIHTDCCGQDKKTAIVELFLELGADLA